jgi:pyridoxal 5'-phosphate synthase pdxS subunit
MRRSFWVVLTAALLVTACSSTPAAKLASAPAERPTPTETDPAPADTFPLTGEPTDDPREDQPIVAVKIENTSAARPQAGLEAADLVFEQLVEGGLTRFAVLFHSELPTDVGPVRSARFVDIDILGSLGSALVYSGARQEVTDALWQQRLIALIADSGRPIFRRAPDRPGSHDLMADLEAALALAVTLPQVTPAPRFLEFGPAPDGGAPGTEVTIRLSGAARTGWQWDAEAAVYRRFQNRNGTSSPASSGSRPRRHAQGRRHHGRRQPGAGQGRRGGRAVAVMALERVPADIRRDGGVARMSDPDMIDGIIDAVSIPVMAKVRIGHFVEAQVIQSLGVDYIDESEVLTPADEANHIDKWAFDVPFVCGATNLGEALRRLSEGAAMIRSKGEAGTGNVVEATRHMRSITAEIRRSPRWTTPSCTRPPRSTAPRSSSSRGRRDGASARRAVHRRRHRHPGRRRDDDAARRRRRVRRVRHLQVRRPRARARAIVEATTHFDDPQVIAKVSRGLGEPMVGINLDELPPEQRYAGRGW